MNIDWFITNRCDQAKFCLFCYAPWYNFPQDAPLAESLRIANRLAEIGAKNVTICGGEPLMYLGIDTVVKRLRELGLRVILYTSATSTKYNVEEFLPYIEFLSLPVDAVTPDIVLKMRGSSQFQNVSSILRRLVSIENRPRIKIGTVVTKQNVGDLSRVRDFLEEAEVVDVWRLYQFSPYGIGKHNQKLFLLHDEEFEEAVRSITNCKLHVSYRNREDTIGYCKIVDSKGAFYRYAEKYTRIGVTIYDDVVTIEEHYDTLKHAQQKAWIGDGL